VVFTTDVWLNRLLRSTCGGGSITVQGICGGDWPRGLHSVVFVPYLVVQFCCKT